MSMMQVKTRKRKLDSFPLDKLNQDILERVLSRLPPSSFFRLRSVCKRWNSIESSATFRLACSEAQSRDPWFLMVGHELDESIVFDTSEGNWKNLSHPILLQQTQFSKSIPVASSGGLVCFRTLTGLFVVCNPLTGACHELPPLGNACDGQTLHAIAMSSSSSIKNMSSYKLVVVLGELPNLKVSIFDSCKNHWEDEFSLSRTSVNSMVPNDGGDEPETVYFLSKAGDVVATNMQRSPSKQYSSVFVVEGDGEEVIYFLGQSGAVIACNLTRKTCNEYPRLLPIYFEYSIDVVECNGEMMVVVLSDFLDTASLRIWRFSKKEKMWQQVAAMPPSMSHDFYGKKADINCVGCGDSIMICLSSPETSSYVMCKLDGNLWVELPKCFMNGRAKEFMSAFSFEPRVEISV